MPSKKSIWRAFLRNSYLLVPAIVLLSFLFNYPENVALAMASILVNAFTGCFVTIKILDNAKKLDNEEEFKKFNINIKDTINHSLNYARCEYGSLSDSNLKKRIEQLEANRGGAYYYSYEKSENANESTES